MNKILLFSLCLAMLVSCADQAGEKPVTKVSEEKVGIQEEPKDNSVEEVVYERPSDKGIGPIQSLELEDKLDETMVAAGKKSFKQLCTACHMIDRKIIGPPLKDVTKRRTPEWIMNMMLNPEQMLKENEIAKKLLEEYVAPMTDQQVSEEDARAILEYLRSEDQKDD